MQRVGATGHRVQVFTFRDIADLNLIRSIDKNNIFSRIRVARAELLDYCPVTECAGGGIHAVRVAALPRSRPSAVRRTRALKGAKPQ
jgi:hypothetical protein